MPQSEEALRQAVQTLRNEGIESPRLDAELLLSHVLGVNRAAIFARPERWLTAKELTAFRDLVDRRAHREPLAYLVGHREFFGLDLVVDSRVLIPRPETELLVEHALRIAQRLKTPRIADVGTGSGAIAVSLAVHLPKAIIYALDGSAGALSVAAENASRHGVADRICFLRGDLVQPLPEAMDVITANLPYVATDEWEALPPEIRLYEPRAALDGGRDGLTLIRRLLATADPYLTPGGVLLAEIGAGQGAGAAELARQSLPQTRVELHQDYAGLDRLLIATKPG